MIEVPALNYAELSGKAEAEPSSEIKKRVDAARARQRWWLEGCGRTATRTWSARDVALLRAEPPSALIENAYRKRALSARSYDRILRVARTIRGPRGRGKHRPGHLAEAIQYGTLGLPERGLSQDSVRAGGNRKSHQYQQRLRARWRCSFTLMYAVCVQGTRLAK